AEKFPGCQRRHPSALARQRRRGTLAWRHDHVGVSRQDQIQRVAQRAHDDDLLARPEHLEFAGGGKPAHLFDGEPRHQGMTADQIDGSSHRSTIYYTSPTMRPVLLSLAVAACLLPSIARAQQANFEP